MQALKTLDAYCISQGYKGWDLFDGLNSKLFRISPLNTLRFCQLMWIQLFKRSPINLRGITRVPKGYNAKGLGLFVSGLVVQGRMDEAQRLLELLQQMACRNYSDLSWGYNFPWMARAFYVPEGKPNMVTTVFVANAFLDFAERTDNREQINKCIEIADQCCQFILQELIVYEDNDTLCFGYIPGEDARVFNASMLGAALLGRVYALKQEQDYLEKSRKAMAYSINALKSDNSWPYGELPHHQFVDNFHTGFNLVALKEWMGHTGKYDFEDIVKKAYRYYLNTFWLSNGCPKYYNNSLYPIDIHCSAQGIVTCIKLKDYDKNSVERASLIAKWAIDNMQNKRGFFYYQKTKFFTNRIPYIRWAQAWMFYALSVYLNSVESHNNSV